MIVTDDRKRRLKKFFHDYAVVVVTAALLLVVLGLLGLARVSALASVKDLSKINPLITSEQNELVAAKNSDEVVKVSKDDDTPSPSPSVTPTAQSQTTGTTDGSTKAATSGSTSSGGTGSGSSGSSGTTSSPPSPAPPFAARIDGSIGENMNTTKSCSGLDLGGSCWTGIGKTTSYTYSYTYSISATIATSNGPGTVAYSWGITPTKGSTTTKTDSFQAANGTASQPISYSWTASSCTSYTITLAITQPTGSQQKTSSTFTPTC